MQQKYVFKLISMLFLRKDSENLNYSELIKVASAINTGKFHEDKMAAKHAGLAGFSLIGSLNEIDQFDCFNDLK